MAGKTLTIHPAQWSGEIADLLARSAHDPLVGVGTLRAMVEAGRGALFAVQDGCELAGAYVLQTNNCEHGSELVLVAAGASLPGFSLTRSVVPYIEQQGAICDRVRINASRAGMGRLLERMGYTKQHSTYTKALHVL